MKQLIKKILPVSLINTARDICDRKKLKVIPQYSFDTALLKPANDFDISAILADENVKDAWLEDIEKIKSVFKDIDTFGGVNPGDRRALYYLIAALKPKSVLEIGTHIGASTLNIALSLKRFVPEAVVTTVDILDVNSGQAPWKNLGLEMSPQSFAKKLDCQDCINFQVSSSQVFLKDTDQRFDFIFLDGDHTSQAVYKEVSLALQKLNPNGIILLHDYYPDAKPLFSNGNIIFGPFRALDRIKKEGADIIVQPLGTLPWQTKLESNVTSLAVVIRN